MALLIQKVADPWPRATNALGAPSGGALNQSIKIYDANGEGRGRGSNRQGGWGKLISSRLGRRDAGW